MKTKILSFFIGSCILSSIAIALPNKVIAMNDTNVSKKEIEIQKSLDNIDNKTLLKRISENIMSIAPITMNDNLIIRNVTTTNSHTLNYTIELQSNIQKSKELKKSLFEQTKKQIKNDYIYMYLLKRGVVFNYYYINKNKDMVATIKIDKDNCK